MIELPRQPTGNTRRCYKCRVRFDVSPERSRARQCGTCAAKPPTAHTHHVPRTPPRPTTTHTAAWSTRELGAAEALALRSVWNNPTPTPD